MKLNLHSQFKFKLEIYVKHNFKRLNYLQFSIKKKKKKKKESTEKK